MNEEILQPLKVLGDIRNEFAHGLDVTLTDTMVEKLWKAFSTENQAIIHEAHITTCAQLDLKEMPKFEETDAQHRFIMMAITIDKYLIVAEKEALNARNTS